MSDPVVPLFGNSDVFYHTMQCFAPVQLCPLSQVCKVWKQGIDWMVRASHENGKFLIENDAYSLKSWVVLSSTTGGCDPREDWEEYVGEPTDKENPRFKVAEIDFMCTADPDAPGKKRYETYVAQYRFNKVKRPICETEMAVVDEKGRLTISSRGSVGVDILNMRAAANKCKAVVGPCQIEVGTSTHNLIELFNHPLKGKENGPVFRSSIFPEIFDQLFTCPEASSAGFVRPEVPKASRNLTWNSQVSRLPNTPIETFIPLAIQCGFDILKTGTCAYVATSEGLRTYARTPVIIQANGNSVYLILGGFAPRAGVSVGDDYDNDDFGAVPGVPAEVKPLVLGSLALEKGD